MEKTFKKEIHSGYKFENGIEVHSHINDPQRWFLTIRELNIFGQGLCDKSCSDSEIARYVFVKIMTKANIVEKCKKAVYPFI